jgi:hypothetical protein
VSAIAAVLLTMPLTGCEITKVRVRLPAFGSGTVDGLWFWRQQKTGGYKRVCRLDLSNSYFSGGREVVNYKQTCVDGRHSSAPWQAIVRRKSGDPKTVTLEFSYRLAGSPAAHRASAFNQHGESALSSASLRL